jgi:hypothetical protein
VYESTSLVATSGAASRSGQLCDHSPKERPKQQFTPCAALWIERAEIGAVIACVGSLSNSKHTHVRSVRRSAARERRSGPSAGPDLGRV